MLVKSNHIKSYALEKCVNNPERGVGLRRKMIAEENNLMDALTELPYTGYDYSRVIDYSDNKKKFYLNVLYINKMFIGVGNKL